MTTAQLIAVQRHIRHLAGNPNGGEQSDGALLRAFLGRNDQAAFEALLRRHGPMVLRVCRRTLGNADDAEDAFQATFLVLARRANSIRKKESLASWLHGVAYRMSTDARKIAARRRKHESRVSPPQPRDPTLGATWQEIQVLLDEEIGGLPESLRGPFVLCCVQNQTCAAAARQLGLQEGTVWNRLGRARKLLQERLTRRGVTLSAGLLTGLLGQNTAPAAVPAALVASTALAATQLVGDQPLVGGPVSAKVLALVKGANQTMFRNQCKSAALLLCCAALVAAGLGMAALRSAWAGPPTAAQPPASEAASDKAKTERPQPAVAEAEAKTREVVKVQGRVLNPDGKPAAGAKLYLGYASSKKMTYPVRATSGNDGRFEFTFPRSELDMLRTDNPKYQVLAVATGHGCAWGTLDAKAAKALTLRLVKDMPVSGRIIDADGRPVAGAKLTVIGVAGKSGFGPFLELPRAGLTGYRLATGRGWVGPLLGQPAVLTTGADGKFRLAGVGRDRAVGFRLEGPAIATAELEVKGTLFEHQAAISRPIRGVVRDKGTGKPLAGVTVSTHSSPPFRPLCKAVTDSKGRFQLLGLRKAKSYELDVKPADGLHFGRRVQLEDTAGLAALTCDIDTVQGEIIVRGKVTDPEGQPIAGATLEYHAISLNPNINKKVAGNWFPGSEATTGADGCYALAAFRGPGMISVTAPNRGKYMPAFVSGKEVKGFFKAPVVVVNGWITGWAAGPGLTTAETAATGDYNAVVLLEPGEKEERLVKDVALARAVERKGRVVGPDGKPLAGVRIENRYNRSKTSEGGEFTLRRINPKGRVVNLQFKHDGKNLGLFLKKLPEEKAGPLIVKLQPCGSASGRLVDQAGQPLAGVRFDLWGKGEITTDKQGRFRVEGLVPGATYDMWNPRKRIGFASVVAEAGKHKDLGDIKSGD